MNRKIIMSWIAWSVILHLAAKTSLASEEGFGWNSLDIHGFVSQGFLKSDGNNIFDGTEEGSFQFNELGINFSTELTERLHAGLQLFSRDLGDIGNNEVGIDWAYGDYQWRDWLGLRAGKIKIPYGLYNETRDIDMLRPWVFLPPSLYYEGNRDIQSALFGAGIYGELYSSLLGAFSYQLQVGETGLSEDSSAIKYAQDREMTALTTMDITRQYALSLEWDTPLEGLKLGGFLMQSDLSISFEDQTELSENSDDTDDENSARTDAENSAEAISDEPHEGEEHDTRRYYVLSAEYVWENLVLSGEYLHPEDSKGSMGYYIGASYRFTDYFEMGSYYSVFYLHADDQDGPQASDGIGRPDYYDWQKELVVTTRVDMGEHWLLKLEGHLIHGAAQLLDQYNSDEIQEDSFLFAIKTTYHF